VAQCTLRNLGFHLGFDKQVHLASSGVIIALITTYILCIFRQKILLWYKATYFCGVIQSISDLN
jgi:hypothetical protein